MGWGIEDDAEVFRLVEAVLTASLKHRLPMFIETHRATITQDLWGIVQIAKQFPEVRFNGDFSHYYCGQEMVYGNWAQKMTFMEPIYSRVAFMHGRIASPSCILVPIDPDLAARPKQAQGAADYLLHFRELWTRAMCGLLQSAGAGDILIFAPEILSARTYYARMFPNQLGQLVEESDRYAQALLYRDLARACFADAHRLLYLKAGRTVEELSVEWIRQSRDAFHSRRPTPRELDWARRTEVQGSRNGRRCETPKPVVCRSHGAI